VNRSPRAASVALALAALAALAGGHLARAQGPGQNPYAPTGSASASGSASMEAPPPLPVVSGHKLWAPRTDVAPLPTEPTPKPTRQEWETAPIAQEVRVTEPYCKVYRLREWYKIHCSHLAIQLVSGDRKDVEFGSFFNSKESIAPAQVWVVFPARRGDRRFFQFYTWSKWAPGSPDAHGSEQWVEGDPLPLITVQGLRYGI
jgi:hypothetical protein